jgi:acetoin utilization deacetylase AcuC-like enzyme
MCSRHVTRDGHQESPARTETIVERLLDSKYGVREWEIIPCESFPPASVKKLASVHDVKYVNFVQKLSESAHRDAAPVAFTPRVQVGLHGTAESAAKSSECCDTFISAGSYYAAAYAAGAVVAAVDAVLDSKCKNAFCAIRPPGHHSGVQGLLQNCVSCGFCIFNSVAIGAAHALERGCERVAIFDFDAHHGNGTEEIVRSLPGKDKVLFISIHLEDTDHADVEDNYTFYPASGKTSSILSRNAIINIPITPTWRCVQTEPGIAPSLSGLKTSGRSRRPPRCDGTALQQSSSCTRVPLTPLQPQRRLCFWRRGGSGGR